MGRRLILAICAGLLAAAAVTVLAAHQALWKPLDNHRLEVEIAAGSSAAEVLDELQRRGLLPSRLAGRLYLAVAASGRTFRFGHYVIPPRSRPVEVLERILDGRVETVTITVVEGSLAATTAEVFADAGIGSVDEWRLLLSRTEWVHDLAPEATTLEGFLFPDTYRFAVGLAPEGAARTMVDRFREVWRELAGAEGVPSGSVYDTVILASLVEAETSIAEERARIAGVFLNRLERGMLLQCDPTVVYALKLRGQWRGKLLRTHWQIDDPYNTYRYPGLPPGPINSPGAAALAAAITPERHSYLYFVAQPHGGHTFSRTLSEHNRAVAEARRKRR